MEEKRKISFPTIGRYNPAVKYFIANGCDTIVIIPGVCRLAYYGELQEHILNDLGYEFDFVNISKAYNTQKKTSYLKLIKHLNPNVNYAKCAFAAAESIKMVIIKKEVNE